MNFKWFVYILTCSDGTFYTGITKDIVARVAVHNRGKGAKYTRARLPVELVWRVEVEGESEARKWEYQVKQMSRKQKKELIIRFS